MVSFVKKHKTLIWAVIIVFIISIVGIYVYQINAIRNVFDEIYLTFSSPNDHSLTLQSLFHIKPVDTLFPYQQFRTTSSSSGVFYKSEYLEKNENISIFPNKELRLITIMFEFKTNKTDMIILKVKYYYDTKTLEYEPLRAITPRSREKGMTASVIETEIISPFLFENSITNELIEDLKKYFIYNKLLQDWFLGNAGKSKFSMENLGDFTIVDNTYSIIGEDWGKHDRNYFSGH